MVDTKAMTTLAIIIMLALIGMIIALLGVNEPGGCGETTQETCQARDTCGWMCRQPDKCSCHTIEKADWAPVSWIGVIQLLIVTVAFVGVGYECWWRPSSSYRWYDAL